MRNATAPFAICQNHPHFSTQKRKLLLSEQRLASPGSSSKFRVPEKRPRQHKFQAIALLAVVIAWLRNGNGWGGHWFKMHAICGQPRACARHFGGSEGCRQADVDIR
jgi:hypothetical protein